MPRSSTRALGLITTLAVAVPTALAAVVVPASVPAAVAGTAQAADPAAAPFRLWAPKQVTAYGYRNRAWTDLGLRAIASDAPFELWSHRPSYDDKIETTWRSPTGDVALPAGSMKDFSGLQRFLKITIAPKRGGAPPVSVYQKACLSGYSERVRPDAPATSPYPTGCWFNAFSLGSVQGIQQGWATPLIPEGRMFRLPAGRYAVSATVRPKYADLFGLDAAEASVSTTLIVNKDDEEEMRHGLERRSSPPTPAAHPPTGAPMAPAEAAAGPVPDLRSLPAWGISVSRNSKYLQFSATVWNAGDSPLVVDGFRRDGEDLMDAYQYFFDSDGNQTGYQDVGHLHWDPKPSHQHWHFEDFARYSLLTKDKTEARRSKKEAFCLANTDAADLTVPAAEWKPENTDLSTSCGDYSSLSIREVLAAGWGDTYTQYRAGQSFRISDLPNGTYYVAVIANPDDNLVESDTSNNVSLRKIMLRGTPDHRSVIVPQVGIIKEEHYGGTG